MYGLARGPADRRQRPEGPRLPRLDPRRAARLHPDRHARRVRPAAPAAPDPVARAVHRPLDVGRLRARAAGAGPDAPAAAAARRPAPRPTGSWRGSSWRAAFSAVAALVVMLAAAGRRRSTPAGSPTRRSSAARWSARTPTGASARRSTGCRANWFLLAAVVAGDRRSRSAIPSCRRSPRRSGPSPLDRRTGSSSAVDRARAGPRRRGRSGRSGPRRGSREHPGTIGSGGATGQPWLAPGIPRRHSSSTPRKRFGPTLRSTG